MENARDLHLPSHHLPARILAVRAGAGAEVQRDTVLLAYETPVQVHELGPDGRRAARDEWQFHELRCSGEGRIVDVKVRAGDVVEDKKHAVMVILEPCGHGVQLNGMCALCGKDMTRADFSGHADTARATIPIAHNMLGLTVSAAEAQRLDRNDAARLLKDRKLTLVLDLDQTVIHATVDPTVGEWMADPTNPNNEALKNVHSFTLPNDPMTVYYVKLRPHVHEFLQEARKMYELHIYTMGTRTYADAVAQALDPDGTIFAGRVLSRDESGSFMHKSLARLFPYEQSMVVVVDDRADVWQWPPNLLRVRPYDFFVGIGDINAHVYEAAKRGEIPVSDVPKAKLAPSPSGSDKDIKPAKDLRQAKLQEEAVAEEAAEDYDTENGEEPPDEDLNEKVLAELDRAQKQELEELRKRRPLAEMAKELEESEDAEMTAEGEPPKLAIDTSVPEGQQPAVPVSPMSPVHKQILKDDDADVPHLLRVLTEIHTRFYHSYDRDQTSKGKERAGKGPVTKADVREIIPSIKQSVFGDLSQGPPVDVVFSSVIPLGTDPTTSDYFQFAVQYGANVSNELHSGVTHVVAGKAGTAKVNQAQRRLKNVWIVRPEWILDSVYTFQRQPESNYLLLDSDGDGKKKHRLGVLTERRALQGTLSEDESEAEGGSDLEILRSPTDQVKMVLEDDDLEEMDREVAEALGEDGEDLESGVSDLELTEQDREDIGLVEASSSEPFTGKRTREDDESDTGVPRLASKRQRWSRPAGDEEDRLSDSMDYGDFIADPDDEEDPYVQALEKADKEIDDPSPRRRQKRPRTAPRRSVDEDAELDENDEDGSSEDERSRVRKPKSKIREVVDEDELLEMWGDPASRMATATSKPRRTLHAVEPMAATPEDSLASVGDQDWDELAADLDKDLADIGSLSDEDSEA